MTDLAHNEPGGAVQIPQRHAVIYTRYWKIGGIERIIAYLVENLTAKGWRFSIITEDPPTPETQFDLGPTTPVYSRVLSPYTPDAIERLKKLVLKLDPDVAVSMGSSRAIYKLSRALRGSTIPVIHSEHNTPHHIKESLYHSEEFLAAIRASCDYLHVLLADFAEDAPAPENVRVIGNPVVTRSIFADVRENPAGAAANTILFVGRFDWKQKQPQVLAEAFSKICDKFPNWRVKFYGDDWRNGKERLEKLIKKYGIEEQVDILNFESEVEGLYLDAKILAFPSAFEGWGLSASEALSYGLPVIAFEECAGVNRLVQNRVNGILVAGATNDADEYAKELEALMADEQLRLGLAANGPETMRQYALPDFVNKWEALLAEGAARKGNNLMSRLTPLEEQAIALLTSGWAFDRPAALQRDAVKLRSQVTALKRSQPNGLLRRPLHSARSLLERALAKVILSPKLYKKYSLQRHAFFADSRHGWLVKYGKRYP